MPELLASGFSADAGDAGDKGFCRAAGLNLKQGFHGLARRSVARYLNSSRKCGHALSDDIDSQRDGICFAAVAEDRF